MRSPVPLHTVSATWVTCRASSRVGTSTSAWQRASAGSMRSSIGSTNAPVLPLPVRAWIIISRPASRYGMARAWTGIRLLHPARAAPCRSASGN